MKQRDEMIRTTGDGSIKSNPIAETMKDVNHTMTSFWNNLSPMKRDVVTFFTFGILFLISSSPSQHGFLLALRLLSGIVFLIALPGACVANCFLPEKLRSVWTSSAIGMVLGPIVIDLLSKLVLITNVRITLISWLTLMNSLVFFGALCFNYFKKNRSSIIMAMKPRIEKKILMILLVAITLRVFVLFFSEGCIAPDAALYADYARNLTDGIFQSNVVNEPRAVDLWNGIQYLPHQGFIYLSAISWLLLPFEVNGPVVILIFSGLLLVVLSSLITKHYFGRISALWVGLTIAVHPLFVFHSVLAYGPELVSLVFILFGIFIFLERPQGKWGALFVVGIAFGMVDIVWYPNFLILCLTFPIILRSLRLRSYEFIGFSILFFLLLLQRLFYNNALAFIGCLLFILAVFGGLHRSGDRFRYTREAAAIVSIPLVINVIWRWHWLLSSMNLDSGQYVTTSSISVLAIIDFQAILRVLSTPIDMDIILRSIFFIIFHLTLPIAIACSYILIREFRSINTSSFYIIALVAIGGTLWVFFSFTKEILLPIYVYSDSRFFLLIILVIVIPTMSGLAKRVDELHDTKEKALKRTIRTRWKSVLVLGLILAGFIPNYLAMPVGMDLIRIEQRYGWSGLSNQVDDLGTASSLFLVDRAREFSWLTGRRSANLFLSTSDDTTVESLARIAPMINALGVDYLLIDGYTLARWGAMHSLLTTSLSIGSAILLDMSILSGLEGLNITSQVPAIAFAAETSPNIRGDYTRLFEFTQTGFSLEWKLDNLDGWSAENYGNLVNSSGRVELVIGNEKNYTQMRRAALLDLDVEVSGGFLLCSVTENDGDLEGIEVLDAYGESIGFAEHWRDGLYFLVVGDAAVGDIRITCNGEGNQSITIDYLALWQHTQ